MRREFLVYAGGAVLLITVFWAAAGADSGDRFYLHYEPWDRSAVARGLAAYEVTGENAAVAMAAEEVTITLHPKYAEVEAVFNFENTAGDREVEMCFPLYGVPLTYAGGKAELEGLAKDIDLEYGGRAPVPAEKIEADFAVTVGVHPVKYRVEDAAVSARGWLSGTAVWPVRFAAGEKKRVVCRYQGFYSGGGGGMLLDLSFTYVLYTGATWKGPIGRGKITVRPGADFDWSVPLYYLGAGVPPARDDGEAIAWEFADLEPAAEEALDVPPEAGYYRHLLPYAAIRVGFIRPDVVEAGYAYSGYRVPPGPGAAAGVLVNGLNFRTAPDASSGKVEGKASFAKGEGMVVLERRDEWYRVRAHAKGSPVYLYVNEHTGEDNAAPEGYREYVEGLGRYIYLDSFVDVAGDRWTRVMAPAAAEGSARWRYEDEAGKERTYVGYEGWVRWRYVDPDTGRENIYVELALTGE